MEQNRVRYGLAACLVATCGLSACYAPQGGLMRYTDAPQTIYSTETSPKTVRLVDVRSGEVLFESPIPVGRQFCYRFEAGGGDEPVERPDRMYYEMFSIGQRFGKLANAMSVPNAASRRIEWDIREGVEYAEAPPEYRLRTDEVADRPAWWTSEGGPMPSKTTPHTMYDD